MVGSSASAVDICRDLAGVAKEVHLVSRSVADGTYEKQPGFDNMWLHSMVKSVFYGVANTRTSRQELFDPHAGRWFGLKC